LILKNYINKDIYRTTATILLLLILIFLSTRFIKYIQLAVDGYLSSEAVFSLLGLQIPAIAGFLIPLSFFLAILLTFGRLYSDNEMMVIHSSGVGERDLAKMIMPLSLYWGLFSAILSLFLTPWAIAQSEGLFAKQAAQAKLGLFSAGRFNETKENGIIFVDKKNENGELQGVFSVSNEIIKKNKIQSSAPFKKLSEPSTASNTQTFVIENKEYKRLLKIQTAESARQWTDKKTHLNYLLLKNGIFYERNPFKDDWKTTQFDSSYMRLNNEIKEEKHHHIKAQTTLYLLQHLRKKTRLSNQSWAALHWRLAAPISIPLIALLAIPLSRTQPRKGKFSRLLPSISIYLLYVLLMMYSRKLIESGELSQWIGFWWIHLLLGGLIYFLYKPQQMIKK
jgi:lipopolysaccharide export system permease protein